MQVPYQLAAIVSVSVWSFVVTYIILVIINKIPSLALRLVDEDEIIGTDWAQMGERAYGYLPFEEDEEADCYRRRSHIDPDVRSIAAGSAYRHPGRTQLGGGARLGLQSAKGIER
ncbi:hypothetical protein G6F68_018509 [Rhizopus microsporus]|nr:hypothetical protein G6F68_018509 [Rhizopus microsporus]